MADSPLVSNSGPLISLARIDRLDLLPSLFGEVLVPPAVHREVTFGDSLVGASALNQAKWLRLVPIKQLGEVERFTSSLDRGEAEALTLAQRLNATIAIDEKRGRRVAAELGLAHTGTVGILLAAKRSSSLPLVRPLLDQLLGAGIRISIRLYEEACRLAGEGTG